MKPTRNYKPRFEFSLQRVLDVRQIQTREAEIMLRSATEALSCLETQIAESRRTLLQQAAEESFVGNLSVVSLRQRSAQKLQAQMRIEADESSLEDLKKSADTQRTKVLNARRSEKTLDALRTTEARQHGIESSRREIAQMDDQAIFRFARCSHASA